MAVSETCLIVRERTSDNVLARGADVGLVEASDKELGTGNGACEFLTRAPPSLPPLPPHSLPFPLFRSFPSFPLRHEPRFQRPVAFVPHHLMSSATTVIFHKIRVSVGLECDGTEVEEDRTVDAVAPSGRRDEDDATQGYSYIQSPCPHLLVRLSLTCTSYHICSLVFFPS